MKVERILYRLRFFVSAKISSYLQISIMAANFVTGVICFFSTERGKPGHKFLRVTYIAVCGSSRW